MYTRATSPGQMNCVVEEGDPIVLTNTAGDVVSRPHPAPPTRELIINYNGHRVGEACWGVLNPDGTLAFQSEVVATLRAGDRVTLKLDQPTDDHLTTDDRAWLARMNRFMPGPAQSGSR